MQSNPASESHRFPDASIYAAGGMPPPGYPPGAGGGQPGWGAPPAGGGQPPYGPPGGYGPPPGYGPPQGAPPGPPKKSNFARNIAIGFFCLVCLLSIGFASNDESSQRGSHASSNAAASSSNAAQSGGDGSSASEAAPKGATVTVGGIATTVLSARITQSASQGFASHSAAAGASLLIVHYSVRNTTNEPIQVLSFADAAVNGAGQSFAGSAECNMAVSSLGIMDTLNPSMPREFDACFEIPAGTTGWTMKVNRALRDGFLRTGL